MKNNVEWELESAKLFEKSVWDVSNEANEVMFKKRNLTPTLTAWPLSGHTALESIL